MGVSGYRAHERFDLNGSRGPLGMDAVFRRTSLDAWFEFGLTRRWTGILSGSLPSLRYEDRSYRASATALGDLQFGVRRSLRSPEMGWQVAAQTLVKAPAYSSRVEPRPGNGQVDLDGSLLAGRSFPVGSRWGFVSAEGGYRKRWGRPRDQWHAEVALGLHVTPRLTLMGQSFNIRRVGSYPPVPPGINPLIEPAFDLYRFQVSGVGRLNSTVRIQVGYGVDAAGRNVGRGQTWLVALWKNF